MGTEYPVTSGAYDLSYQGGQGAIPTDIGITKFNAQFRYRYWHGEFTNSKPSNLFMGFMDKHLSKFSNKIKGKIEDKIFG